MVYIPKTPLPDTTVEQESVDTHYPTTVRPSKTYPILISLPSKSSGVHEGRDESRGTRHRLLWRRRGCSKQEESTIVSLLSYRVVSVGVFPRPSRGVKRLLVPRSLPVLLNDRVRV